MRLGIAPLPESTDLEGFLETQDRLESTPLLGLEDAEVQECGTEAREEFERFAESFAGIVVWMLAGTSCYATLYCLGVSIYTDQAWIATSMMVAMCGMTLAIASMFGTRSQPELIRVQRTDQRLAILFTLLQILFFWQNSKIF